MILLNQQVGHTKYPEYDPDGLPQDAPCMWNFITKSIFLSSRRNKVSLKLTSANGRSAIVTHLWNYFFLFLQEIDTSATIWGCVLAINLSITEYCNHDLEKMLIECNASNFLVLNGTRGHNSTTFSPLFPPHFGLALTFCLVHT